MANHHWFSAALHDFSPVETGWNRFKWFQYLQAIARHPNQLDLLANSSSIVHLLAVQIPQTFGHPCLSGSAGWTMSYQRRTERCTCLFGTTLEPTEPPLPSGHQTDMLERLLIMRSSDQTVLNRSAVDNDRPVDQSLLSLSQHSGYTFNMSISRQGEFFALAFALASTPTAFSEYSMSRLWR